MSPKSAILSILVLAGSFPASALAQPDDAGTSRPHLRPGQRHGPRDPGQHMEHRLQRMTEELRLNPSQADQVRTILEDTRHRMEALRNQSQGPSPETHRARQQIRWDAEDRIHAVLTCDQRDQLRRVRREHHARHMERRFREGGPHGRGRHPRGRRQPGPADPTPEGGESF